MHSGDFGIKSHCPPQIRNALCLGQNVVLGVANSNRSDCRAAIASFISKSVHDVLVCGLCASNFNSRVTCTAGARHATAPFGMFEVSAEMLLFVIAVNNMLNGLHI